MPSFYYKFFTKKNITSYAIFVVPVVVVVVFFIHKWTDESVLHLYNRVNLIEHFIPVWVQRNEFHSYVDRQNLQYFRKFYLDEKSGFCPLLI